MSQEASTVVVLTELNTSPPSKETHFSTIHAYKLNVDVIFRKPDAGSFVRIKKINPPLGFFQALCEQYLKASADEDEISLHEGEMKAPFLQLFGFDKTGSPPWYLACMP